MKLILPSNHGSICSYARVPPVRVKISAIPVIKSQPPTSVISTTSISTRSNSSSVSTSAELTQIVGVDRGITTCAIVDSTSDIENIASKDIPISEFVPLESDAVHDEDNYDEAAQLPDSIIQALSRSMVFARPQQDAVSKLAPVSLVMAQSELYAPVLAESPNSPVSPTISHSSITPALQLGILNMVDTCRTLINTLTVVIIYLTRLYEFLVLV